MKILEARDRVGGVNWTMRRGSTHTEIGAGGETQVCNFDEGLYHNGGPWRLPHWHTGVLGYCKELGVPLEIFVNEGEASYFYYEGDNIGPLANKRVRLREVKADMLGYTCELMAKAVDQNALDVPLSAEDKESSSPSSSPRATSTRPITPTRRPPRAGPGIPHDFRALLQSGFPNRIRSVSRARGRRRCSSPSAAWTSSRRASSGSSATPSPSAPRSSRFARATRDVKVAYQERQDRARRRKSTADYCVSCLPLTILSSLDVNLSPETMAAVKATPYSPSAKMGLQMKRRFWEEDDRIFGGHLYSNLPIRQLLVSVGRATSATRACCSASTATARCRASIDKPIKGRVEHVLTHASKVHPQIRAEFETAYCTFWEKTPYSLGAFAGGGGGGANADRLTMLGKPDHRIFLGCAAVSGNGGWQEGAVAAAWKQVKQLHERVMTTRSSARHRHGVRQHFTTGAHMRRTPGLIVWSSSRRSGRHPRTRKRSSNACRPMAGASRPASGSATCSI